MDIVTLSSRLIAIWKGFKRIFPSLFIVVFMVTFAVLTYLAIMPRDDEVEKTKGDKKVEELDFSFNQKLISEISISKEPAATISGRNPFSN